MSIWPKKIIDEDSTDVSTDDETVNRKSKKKRHGKSSVQRVSLIGVNVDVIILPRIESFLNKRIRTPLAGLKMAQ